MTTLASAATGSRWKVNSSDEGMSLHDRLVRDVRCGMFAESPTLPPRWFYDCIGSRLFERITMLPEYYPTRRETEILAERADEIAHQSGASTLVEFGSGTSTKTTLLLDAFTSSGRHLLFVPIDISTAVLTEAAAKIAMRYPNVTVTPLARDFDDPLRRLPGTPGERIVVFLGGTIGNFDSVHRRGFLRQLRRALAPGDQFLLGADLVKDEKTLLRAYDDSAGVTAEFNRNVIEVLRRELHATGLDPDNFDHVVRWNAARERVEMWLRARDPVYATFPDIGEWQLPAGKEMLTEISVKFRRPRLRRELESAGFRVLSIWTDARQQFSLTLAEAWCPAQSNN